MESVCYISNELFNSSNILPLARFKAINCVGLNTSTHIYASVTPNKLNLDLYAKELVTLMDVNTTL